MIELHWIVGGYKIKWAACVDLRLVPSFSCVVFNFNVFAVCVFDLPCEWIFWMGHSIYFFHIGCLHFIEILDEMFSATLFCDGLKQINVRWMVLVVYSHCGCFVVTIVFENGSYDVWNSFKEISFFLDGELCDLFNV